MTMTRMMTRRMTIMMMMMIMIGAENLAAAAWIGAEFTPTTSGPPPSTTPNPDQWLLYGVVAVCATIVFLACCCGCICMTKMRYRVRALQIRFTQQVAAAGRGTGGAGGRGAEGEDVEGRRASLNEYTDMPMDDVIGERKDDWEVEDKALLVSGERLGSGAFAIVYKGRLLCRPPMLRVWGVRADELEETGDEVAVKMVAITSTDDARADLVEEIRFMKKLGFHAHVVNMLACRTVPRAPALIMELCANGDLLRFVRSHKDEFALAFERVESEDHKPEASYGDELSYRHLISFSWQAADALNFLASRSYIHRDVAARNILLTGQLVAKLSDFGLCRYTADEAQYTTKGGKVPIKWMAPESLTRFEYTTKSDVWSFGVLLWEIFSLGDAPWVTVAPDRMATELAAGKRLPRPTTCPDLCYNLMTSCWAGSPDARPTFSELRERLAILLDVHSDSYGYLEFGHEYKAMYTANPAGQTKPLPPPPSSLVVPSIAVVDETLANDRKVSTRVAPAVATTLQVPSASSAHGGDGDGGGGRRKTSITSVEAPPPPSREPSICSVPSTTTIQAPPSVTGDEASCMTWLIEKHRQALPSAAGGETSCMSWLIEKHRQAAFAAKNSGSLSDDPKNEAAVVLQRRSSK